MHFFKKLAFLPWLIVALMLGAPAFAQGPVITSGPPNPKTFAGAPTGTCGPQDTAVNTTTGDFYSCNAGTWLKVNGGGGGGMGGSGTVGNLPIFVTNSTLGNSNITQDANGNALFGTKDAYFKNGTPYVGLRASNCAGDGVTDDTACVTSAVAAAGKGILDFECTATSPRMYLVSSPITLVNGVNEGMTLRGNQTWYANDGTGVFPDNCGFKAKTGVTAFNVLVVSANGVHLQDFVIEGQSRTTGACKNGILLDNAARSVVERVAVQNCTLDGILSHDGEINVNGNDNGMIIRNNRLHSNGKWGIEVLQGTAANNNASHYQDNDLFADNAGGMLLRGIANKVEGGLYYGNMGPAIKIGDGSNVNTTVAANISTGTQTVTPAAMTNILVGSNLVINSGLSDQEFVAVSAFTGATFTAFFLKAHTGPGITVTSTPDGSFTQQNEVYFPQDLENTIPLNTVITSEKSVNNFIFTKLPTDYLPMLAGSTDLNISWFAQSGVAPMFILQSTTSGFNTELRIQTGSVGSNAARIQPASGENTQDVAGLTNLDLAVNGNGTGKVILNDAATSGTGGVKLGNGTSGGNVFGSSNLGVDADDIGFKHKRVSGCQTGASQGSVCTTTITWTTAFADANYSAVCIGDVITSGVPVNGGLTAKVAASITFQTVAATAAAAQYTNIDCEATHDP